MNKKQFSKVLKASMKYYRYSTENADHFIYMCLAIDRCYYLNKISRWEREQAKKKIDKLIGTGSTLSDYLVRVKGYKLKEITSQVRLDFWAQHIIGGK